MVPPVREGEEIDVQIEAVGEKGDGIAKVRNFVIFVPNTKQGDNVRIRVTKVLKRVGFGEVIGDAQSVPEAPAEDAQAEESEPEPEAEQQASQVEESPDDSENFGEEEEPQQ